METGKQKCWILKEIRKQIAEANDIEFITSECKHRGNCLGTCPKCEAEVHYLEQQLLSRQKMGLTIRIVGISLGLSTMGLSSLYGQNVAEDSLKKVPNMLPQVEIVGYETVVRKSIIAGLISVGQDDNTIITKGIVIDKCGNPITGAEIVERGANNRTLTDQNGRFTLQISVKRPVLEVSHSEMKTRRVRVRKKKATKIKVVLRKEVMHKNEVGR